MKTSNVLLALAVCSGLAILAVAQESQPQDRPSKPAETKLVGVNILDTGMSILSRFGSPDQIQALTVGTRDGASIEMAE